jgi:hypothetical protein
MASTMCSDLGVTSEPGPNGGIIEWIINHPLESALMLLATGAMGYLVYDSMKEKKYVPAKTKTVKPTKAKASGRK